MLNDKEMSKRAKKFSKDWEGKGYEKGQCQTFWLMLLMQVFGIENASDYIEFEDHLVIDGSSFIDAYIPSTKVLIEQKSIDKSLTSPIRQSDGTMLTPFEQARRYISKLPLSRHPRWIITCNFKEFYIYDMEKITGEPEHIELKDLGKEYYRLAFIIDKDDTHIKKEMEMSFKAGDIAGALYDAFSKQYANLETNEAEQKSLNQLIVRIVFCLYAEDAGLFGRKNKFHDYLSSYPAKELRKALIDLFKMLDTKEEDRDQYDDPVLLSFPYVNGGLFSDENIIIPHITEEIKELLLTKASDNFDWSEISPTIFGAIFESTLNPETRRSGGMHYTSIENIHKVIDPLFLDDLKAELEEIRKYKDIRVILKKVREYQDKLSSLKFLDPACGSGNFLTETYICLRRLENEAIKLENMEIEFFSPIKVSIAQFFGIEINDFAVTVAKTALWIAESQMMKETEEICHAELEFFPLQTNSFILEGNALDKDWETVFGKDEISYIMGNPPFLGASNMSKTQKEEIMNLFKDVKKAGDLDYVTGWYKKTVDFIEGTNIRAAYVSTNSICQGESVGILWKYLILQRNIHIDFAYKTFVWDSEANLKAHVHCVIVGFSCASAGVNKKKIIYDGNRIQIANNINGYLLDGDNLFIESFTKPLCDVPKMIRGSSPCDNGNFSFTEEEMAEFVRKNPQLEKYIKPYIGASEFINRKSRYCIWLYGADQKDIVSSKDMLSRLENVRRFRLESRKPQTNELANTPNVWEANRYNGKDFILIPRVSSERRKYIPIGFVNGGVVANDACQLVPNADVYQFGILTSNVHNAWMRLVAGRLKSDYRYSNLVYNSFIWPNVTEEQYNKIKQTAQEILNAREKYPDASLADLYGENMYLYPELMTAHQHNDIAVLEAYKFYTVDKGKKKWYSEQQTVEELFRLYKEKCNN